jgi:DNA-binding GntR family transcriptional regulator
MPTTRKPAAKAARKGSAEKASKSPTSARRGRGFGASHVYENLRADILALRLAPGSLLDETELASRFEISRSPVREALIRLAGEGLVHTLRNRSSIVAPFDVATIQSHLGAMLLMYCMTARLAAMHRTSAQLQRLRAMLEEHRAAMKHGDTMTLVSNNRDFHVAVAEAGGNSFFTAWIATVLDQGQRLMGVYLQDPSIPHSDEQLNEHAAIVDAIDRCDADAAERAARSDALIVIDELKRSFFKDTLQGVSTGRLLAGAEGGG